MDIIYTISATEICRAIATVLVLLILAIAVILDKRAKYLKDNRKVEELNNHCAWPACSTRITDKEEYCAYHRHHTD